MSEYVKNVDPKRPLADVMADLDAVWAEKGFPMEKLRPGLKDHEVIGSCQKAGLVASPEVVQWFMWHDGAVPPMTYSVSGDALSLGEALEHYETYIINGGDPSLEHHRGWLPLLREADVIVANCTGDQTKPQIGYFFRDCGIETLDISTSMTTLLQWWLYRFQQDHWVYAPTLFGPSIVTVSETCPPSYPDGPFPTVYFC